MKIKEAAMIWDKDGKVYTGLNHPQIIHRLAKAGSVGRFHSYFWVTIGM